MTLRAHQQHVYKDVPDAIHVAQLLTSVLVLNYTTSTHKFVFIHSGIRFQDDLQHKWKLQVCFRTRDVAHQPGQPKVAMASYPHVCKQNILQTADSFV